MKHGQQSLHIVNPTRRVHPDMDRSAMIKEARVYEITLSGHLDEQWVEWLGDLKADRKADGTTRLSGIIPDQAALHGLLVRIRNLGLTLISITSVEDQDGDME